METGNAAAPAERVRGELARYEHPLFALSCRPNGEGVEVEIRFRLPEPQFDPYVFVLREREIDNPQFPWTFQKQLYDCLHDYIIEMFTSNPQRRADAGGR